MLILESRGSLLDDYVDLLLGLTKCSFKEFDLNFRFSILRFSMIKTFYYLSLNRRLLNFYKFLFFQRAQGLDSYLDHLIQIYFCTSKLSFIHNNQFIWYPKHDCI